MRHDLNNHLAVIKLYAQLGLRHPDLAPDLKEGFEIVMEQLSEIKDLMDKGSKEEVQLKANIDHMDLLLGNLPGMAYRCQNAPGWPMVFVSEGCHPLTGYKPREILKQAPQYEDIIHPKDRKYVDEKVQEGVSAGRPFIIEYRIITKNGQEKWVWEKGQEITGPDGQEKWLEGFIMDITQRIAAQEALKESEQRYSVAFHSSPYAMIITRMQDGYILDANHSFEVLTGHLIRETKGRDTIAINIWADLEDRIEVMKDLRNNIQVINREYSFRKKDGEIRLGQYTADIVTINNEPYILSSFSDITEKKRTESALRETEEKLLNIFRVAPSGIGLVKDRVIMEVNDRICEMTGYTTEDLIGQSALMLYPGQEDYDYVGREKYEQIRKKGIGIVESHWKRKDGQVIDVLLASIPMVAGDNSRGVIFTALDITERKIAEEEQKILQEQLFEAQKMETVGRLAGGVAHEFNNALQIVKTYAELSLIKTEPDSPILPYLDQIITSTRQSSGMISQLLAFARKQAVSPEEVNLNQIIDGLTVMLQKLIGDRIELKWEPFESAWPVKIDPVQVNQVILNLVINARDAIPEDGQIIIRTRNASISEKNIILKESVAPGDYVMLSVSDNGCGIDKKNLDKIFEPFFTTKEKFKGTGLGLSTVYGIVKQNNGFVSVESKVGRGSTFKLYLPRYT